MNKMVSRRKIHYENVIKPDLMKKFQHSNNHSVAKLEAIFLSMGFGKQDPAKFVENMTIIAGQIPVVTKAKKSVAQFNIREGNEIGCKVSLRGNNMYHFLDRLFIGLLNFRRFEGFKKSSFIQHGRKVSFSIGINDIGVFHGIVLRSATKLEGINITMVMNASTIDEAVELINLMGFPIRSRNMEPNQIRKQ